MPLVFRPILKTRVWGGETLKCRPGVAPKEPVGESWELADHGADSTVVASGELAGKSLRDLFERDRYGLCGEAIDPANPDVFPLLLKLIDPCADLSVQVHPDDAYAGKKVVGELGKTEAWYVLEAQPGAKIYKGFKPGVTREILQQALKAGTVADTLNAFEASAGDVVYLPAGVVHALGAGVRIAEIQQNSDTTYRVFDWNRVGLDSKPRELHIDDALAVTDFSPAGENTMQPDRVDHPGCVREHFFKCEKFSFERLRGFAGGKVFLDTGGRRFHILTVAEGTAEISTPGGTVARGRWDLCLIPAGTGRYAVSASADAVILLFYR